MRDPRTPRVFVSYSRKDSLGFARRLQTLLKEEGLSLYRDLTDLESASRRPGEGEEISPAGSRLVQV